MTSPGGQEVGRISIRVVPNTSRFRADLQRQLSAIEKEVRATVDVDVNLDEDGVKARMRATMAELRAQAARGVDVRVGVDKSMLSRLSSLGGGGGGGFGGLSHGLLITAAVAAFAAPALALVSGVLVTLPALITAAVVPIAALALGMDGLKKAAEVLKDPLAELKATMSDSFQERFTPIFQKLRDIFPVLRQEMPKIATGLGDMAQAFVDSVTSEKGMDAIRSTISNIGQALSDSAPGIANFTDGFLKLISTVSEKLPNLSKIFNGWGDSFSGWVTKITTPSWFDGKTPLDNGLKSFKDTLQEILNLVGDLATKGFEFLSDPKFGDKMKEFVSSIKTLVNDVLPGLATFFMDISDAVKGITDAIHSFDAKPQADAKAAIIAQGQANQNKGAGDANLPAWIDPEGWGISIRQWFEKIGPQISSWASTTWGQFTSSFTQQFGIIAQAWSANWESLKSVASTAWSTIVAQVGAQINSIGSFFAGVPAALNAAWASLSSVASTAWSGVTSAVSSAWEAIKSAVSTGVDAVVSFVSGMGDKIISAITSIDLGSAGSALMDGLLGGIKAGVQKVYDFVSGIAKRIAELKGPLPYDRTVLTPNGQALMQGLQDGIEGGFQGVLDRAKAMAQEISDAINSGGPIDASGLNDKLKRQIAEIGLQSDELKVQLNGTTDKGQKDVIRDQRAQLQSIRDQLNLQQDQLGFSQKYGDSLDKNDQTLGQSLSKMVDIGTGFATANIKQAQSDLGISGKGLTSVAEQGLGWATSLLGNAISGMGNTTIQVNSLDEALAAKTNLTNKKALQFDRR